MKCMTWRHLSMMSHLKMRFHVGVKTDKNVNVPSTQIFTNYITTFFWLTKHIFARGRFFFNDNEQQDLFWMGGRLKQNLAFTSHLQISSAELKKRRLESYFSIWQLFHGIIRLYNTPEKTVKSCIDWTCTNILL